MWVSPNQCCASKPFVKRTLMPIPGCSFSASLIPEVLSCTSKATADPCLEGTHLCVGSVPNSLHPANSSFPSSSIPLLKLTQNPGFWIRNSISRAAASCEHGGCRTGAPCSGCSGFMGHKVRVCPGHQEQHPASLKG